MSAIQVYVFLSVWLYDQPLEVSALDVGVSILLVYGYCIMGGEVGCLVCSFPSGRGCS